MRRFRSIVGLVSLLLVLPCAFLIAGAYESIEQAEHDAFRRIASARFDRIEEELLAILELEDQRPVSDFTAPRSDSPAQPEMVGWFQIDPEGVFSSPLQGDSERLLVLREACDWYTDHRLASELVLPEFRPFLRDVPVARITEPGRPWMLGGDKALTGTSAGGSPAGARSYSGKGGPPPLEAPVAAQPAAADPVTQAVPQAVPKAAERGTARTAAEAHRQLVASGVRLEIDPVQILPMDGELLLGVRRAWVDGRQLRQLFVMRAKPLLRRITGMALRAVPGDADARFRIHYDHTGPMPESWTVGALRGPSRFYAVRSCARPFDCFRIRLDSSEVDAGFSRSLLWLVVGVVLGVVVLGVVAIDRALASLVESAKRRQGFVSSVTHELKTPLTTIRMYGEMLRDGVVTDEKRQHEYHAAIAAESERLARLVDNVLDLAKLEKGRYRFRLAAGDVGEIMRSVAETMRVYASSLGFELEVEVANDIPEAMFDADALVQVLINLVDNALKFSRDHEPHVVTLRAMEREDAVLVAVVDHGPGIASHDLGRVVRPFYRSDDGLTRDTRGTGLGLGLVRLLSEGMGGRLVLTNNLEGGLSATVELVAARGKAS